MGSTYFKGIQLTSLGGGKIPPLWPNEIRDFLTKQPQDRGCVVACPCGNKEPDLPLFSSAITGEVFHINRHIPDHGDGGLPFGRVL